LLIVQVVKIRCKGTEKGLFTVSRIPLYLKILYFYKKISMDAQKVDLFLLTSSKYFESQHIQIIREKLLQTDDSKMLIIQTLPFRDPVLLLIISLLGGHFGIDRFILGDVGLGVAKLLTCGGLGIWTLVDWFLIMDRTREVNLEKLRQVI